MPPGFGVIVGVLTRTIVGSRIQVPEVWNYTQSEFFEKWVPSSTLPIPSGYFQITQTGNSVTAIDDQGVSYRGVIDGANCSWVKTYPEDAAEHP